MRDLRSNLQVFQTIRPAVISANTSGLAVDTRGFDSVMVAITTGTASTTASHNVTAIIEEAHESSSTAWTTAATVGGSTEALPANDVLRVNVFPLAPFVRCRLTRSAGFLAVGAAVALGNPHQAPVEDA